MGPRIAVVTALCQLAAAAGLVPSSPAGSMLTPSSQGPGGGGDLKKAAMAAGVELWREWMQVGGGGHALGSGAHGRTVAVTRLHAALINEWQSQPSMQPREAHTYASQVAYMQPECGA